jgi:hypothetical protein
MVIGAARPLNTPPNLVTGCLDDFTQNGDLDFDGTDYYPDFPNSLRPGPFPSPFLQRQPTTAGARYSGMQFETDAPASEITTCVPQNPQGCVVPPPNGPGHFYPYYTLAKVGGQCVWEFGHMNNGNRFRATSSTPTWSSTGSSRASSTSRGGCCPTRRSAEVSHGPGRGDRFAARPWPLAAPLPARRAGRRSPSPQTSPTSMSSSLPSGSTTPSE